MQVCPSSHYAVILVTKEGTAFSSSPCYGRLRVRGFAVTISGAMRHAREVTAYKYIRGYRGSTSYIEQGAEDRRSITKVNPRGVTDSIGVPMLGDLPVLYSEHVGPERLISTRFYAALASSSRDTALAT
jgi:hypothetical protein